MHSAARALFRSLLDHIATSRRSFYSPAFREPRPMGNSAVCSCRSIVSRSCFSCEPRGFTFYGRWVSLAEQIRYFNLDRVVRRNMLKHREVTKGTNATLRTNEISIPSIFSIDQKERRARSVFPPSNHIDHP